MISSPLEVFKKNYPLELGVMQLCERISDNENHSVFIYNPTVIERITIGKRSNVIRRDLGKCALFNTARLHIISNKFETSLHLIGDGHLFSKQYMRQHKSGDISLAIASANESTQGVLQLQQLDLTFNGKEINCYIGEKSLPSIVVDTMLDDFYSTKM